MEKQYNYPDIIKVFSTSREEVVNDYLDLGWVLLNVSQYTEYTLGWDKTKGEIKEPKYVTDLPF
ncbi:hypothetical protein [Heyndrickxia camelliae]|uniref:Uncharacterized protein n=1 Tax=Heyndrickxia camelliae TaxID=1707093 RepID=A0A2N3LE27_9BACI|nr:hypothetical protein [Heyndrickxia camelliae]PKR82892.1 hypothetical protein CWO92_22135 [Heyndrickxia camelliae]